MGRGTKVGWGNRPQCGVRVPLDGWGSPNPHDQIHCWTVEALFRWDERRVHVLHDHHNGTDELINDGKSSSSLHTNFRNVAQVILSMTVFAARTKLLRAWPGHPHQLS